MGGGGHVMDWLRWNEESMKNEQLHISTIHQNPLSPPASMQAFTQTQAQAQYKHSSKIPQTSLKHPSNIPQAGKQRDDALLCGSDDGGNGEDILGGTDDVTVLLGGE